MAMSAVPLLSALGRGFKFNVGQAKDRSEEDVMQRSCYISPSVIIHVFKKLQSCFTLLIVLLMTVLSHTQLCFIYVVIASVCNNLLHGCESLSQMLV